MTLNMQKLMVILWLDGLTESPSAMWADRKTTLDNANMFQSCTFPKQQVRQLLRAAYPTWMPFRTHLNDGVIHVHVVLLPDGR